MAGIAMDARCPAEQVAEAMTIWSIKIRGSIVLCTKRETSKDFKPLDLILSTLDIFIRGFDEQFDISYNKHKQQFLFSKKEFMDFLKPRCLLLSRNNGCFDLFLTCAFVCRAIVNLSSNNSCCHLTRVCFKLLTKVLEDRFAEMFTESGWETLMSYCRKVHHAGLPSDEDRPLVDYKDFLKEEESGSEDSVSNDDLNVSKPTRQEQLEVESIHKEQDTKACAEEMINEEFGTLVIEEAPVTGSSDGKSDTSQNKEEIDSNDYESNVNLNESKNTRQEEFESSYDYQTAKIIGQCSLKEKESIASPTIKEAMGTESSDDFQQNSKSDSISSEKFNKSNRTQQKQLELESGKDDENEKVFGQIGSLEKENEMNDFPSIAKKSDDESSDDEDESYWYHTTASASSIFKRISENPEQRIQVRDLLKMLALEMDPEKLSTNEYELPLSDDEEIKNLEKRQDNLDSSVSNISVSEKLVEHFVGMKKCEEQYKAKYDESSDTSEEEATDAERLEALADLMGEDEELQCELCYWKMRPYKTKWLQCFSEKYSNFAIVSDFLLKYQN